MADSAAVGVVLPRPLNGGNPTGWEDYSELQFKIRKQTRIGQPTGYPGIYMYVWVPTIENHPAMRKS